MKPSVIFLPSRMVSNESVSWTMRAITPSSRLRVIQSSWPSGPATNPSTVICTCSLSLRIVAMSECPVNWSHLYVEAASPKSTTKRALLGDGFGSNVKHPSARQLLPVPKESTYARSTCLYHHCGGRLRHDCCRTAGGRRGGHVERDDDDGAQGQRRGGLRAEGRGRWQERHDQVPRSRSDPDARRRECGGQHRDGDRPVSERPPARANRHLAAERRSLQRQHHDGNVRGKVLERRRREGQEQGAASEVAQASTLDRQLRVQLPKSSGMCSRLCSTARCCIRLISLEFASHRMAPTRPWMMSLSDAAVIKGQITVREAYSQRPMGERPPARCFPGSRSWVDWSLTSFSSFLAMPAEHAYVPNMPPLKTSSGRAFA